MTNDQLYQIVQSKKSTGSGRGASFYEVAANCGRSLNLKMRHPDLWSSDDDDGTSLTPTGRRKCNALRAGTFFHTLQELWRNQTLPADLVLDATEMVDYDFELALRAFRNYRARFGDNIHNLGTVVATEEKYPADPAQAAMLKQVLGLDFTMRFDLLTYVSREDAERISSEREVAITPGRWLVDYKLVASISEKTYWKYAASFQGLVYPVVYNLCNPQAPVEGIMYDITARVQKAEPKHFALYTAITTEDSLEIVKTGLNYAKELLDSNRANPLVCTSGYSVCPFLKNGMCDRK